MGTVYAGSDVLLLPSASEGLSNSLLEAMSSGCVPVLTDIGSGVEDVMPEDLRRLIVPVGDASGMAALVTRLAGQPDEIETLGRLAHAATADFSWGRYRDRLTTLLAEVEAE
jgi:glycosyltransferase involved in cell wall biosynthesis